MGKSKNKKSKKIGSGVVLIKQKEEKSDFVDDNYIMDVETIKLEDHEMSYGCHKGKKLKDIDNQYLKYLCSLPDYFDDDVINYVKSLPTDVKEEYSFHFGKFKGKTLSQVYNHKEGKVYLNYITHQPWFNNKDIVKDFLMSMV